MNTVNISRLLKSLGSAPESAGVLQLDPDWPRRFSRHFHPEGDKFLAGDLKFGSRTCNLNLFVCFLALI